jgi:hypothetical protein
MVKDWNGNGHNQLRWNQVNVFAFPNGYGNTIPYNLRNRESWKHVFTLVDPRLYPWKAYLAHSAKTGATGAAIGPGSRRKVKASGTGSSKSGVSKKFRVSVNPPRWYFKCSDANAAHLKGYSCLSGLPSVSWNFKDGNFIPTQTPNGPY